MPSPGRLRNSNSSSNARMVDEDGHPLDFGGDNDEDAPVVVDLAATGGEDGLTM